MSLLIAIPLQVTGLLFAALYVLVAVSVLYWIWKIAHNTSRMATDMEQIVERLEDLESEDNE